VLQYQHSLTPTRCALALLGMGCAHSAKWSALSSGLALCCIGRFEARAGSKVRTTLCNRAVDNNINLQLTTTLIWFQGQRAPDVSFVICYMPRSVRSAGLPEPLHYTLGF